MAALIDTNVTTVIESEVFEEQDLLFRRTVRPHDSGAVLPTGLSEGHIWNQTFEDRLLDRFSSGASKYDFEQSNSIPAKKSSKSLRSVGIAIPASNTSNDVIVNGNENNDTPAEYIVKGVKPHEFPVIGVYVHRKITPGFPYRVRYNGSDQYLFDGKSKCLLSIGMGYGKRLTFTGDQLNDNDCYFWSDSHPEGFAFSLVAVEPQQKLQLYTTQMGPVGEVIIESVRDEQEEEATEVSNGVVSKTVRVVMDCSINYYQRHRGLLDLHHTDIETITGQAVLIKPKGTKRAFLKCIENVFLSRFGLCSLYKD